MSNWTGVITNAGKAELASWVSGATLNITSAKAGTGTVAAASLIAQTALAEEKQTMSMISTTVSGSGRKIRLQMEAPATAYTLNQIGIWGAVGSGTPVLLAIYQNETGIPIPSSSQTEDYLYTFYAFLAISNTGTLNVTIDSSAAVSESTMEAYVNSKKQKVVSLSLPTTSWVGSVSPYTQAITITGSTANTKVDLQPDATIINQLVEDGCIALYIENNNGTLTAKAIGEKPTVNLTIQATHYEVSA